MQNQNSTTIETEEIDPAKHEDEHENGDGQQGDKALSRGQKKKLKKKMQKEKEGHDESSQVEKLASGVSELKISDSTQPSSTEESKTESKNDSNQNDKKEGDTGEAELTPQQQFQKELDWCIRQIKLGLENNKVTKDQMKESMDVLKVLQSADAPLIKKRHLMKVVFGDYRKLMKEIN